MGHIRFLYVGLLCALYLPHHHRYRLTELICSLYIVYIASFRYLYTQHEYSFAYLCLINFVNSTECREWAKWRNKKKILNRERVFSTFSPEQNFLWKKSLRDHHAAKIKSRYYDCDECHIFQHGWTSTVFAHIAWCIHVLLIIHLLVLVFLAHYLHDWRFPSPYQFHLIKSKAAGQCLLIGSHSYGDT